MLSIEEYIEKSKNMPNISDGGSPAYDFGDAILVVYENLNKYGDARENEEQIMQAINEKNAQGVRTPKHLAVKRIVDEEKNYCYVLQEKAKGKNFSHYRFHNSIVDHLKNQQVLALAPTAHYAALARDLGQLFYFGIETKAKNLFYDESLDNGGFTIIDILGYSDKVIDFNSLSDIIRLNHLLKGIATQTTLVSYGKNIPEEAVLISKEYENQIFLKMFNALSRIIPDFENKKRWILRTYTKEQLEYFKNNGVSFDDLRLNDQEEEEYNNMLNEIVKESIKKIESGAYSYWQIEVNEIRNDLYFSGLKESWLYHPKNKRNINDYDSQYDYESDSLSDLQKVVLNRVNDCLTYLAKTTTNPHILTAKEYLDSLDPETGRK